MLRNRHWGPINGVDGRNLIAAIDINACHRRTRAVHVAHMGAAGGVCGVHGCAMASDAACESAVATPPREHHVGSTPIW